MTLKVSWTRLSLAAGAPTRRIDALAERQADSRLIGTTTEAPYGQVTNLGPSEQAYAVGKL